MRRSFLTPLRRLLLVAALGCALVVFFLANSRYNSIHLGSYGLSRLPWSISHEDEADSNGSSIPQQDQENHGDDPQAQSDKAWNDWALEQPVQDEASTSAYAHEPAYSETPVTQLEQSAHSNTTPPLAVATSSYEETQARIKEWVDTWPIPDDAEHWPPYDGYREEDYDPNIWESFPWNPNFYTHPGVNDVHRVNATALYGRYPDYNSAAWSKKYRGTYSPCEGARGKLLNASEEDWIKPFGILPSGFPNPTIGSTNATNISFDHCTDRYHRYGPYGFAQGDREGVEGWQRPIIRPDWTTVNWKSLQDQCLLNNKDRYLPTAREPTDLSPGKKMPKAEDFTPLQQVRTPSYHRRTAILVRLGEGYPYTEDDLENIRALITELALLSGAEYQVFILFEVKDDNLDIWNNRQLYRDVLNTVPRELRSITILYNEKLLEELYPHVGHYDGFWHPFMPIQWFSLKYPEFDHVWNWYPDVRYTGNYYELLAGISGFAKQAPRKYLWERNQRFYIHSVHGSYKEFFNSTNDLAEHAASKGKLKPVWGPRQGSYKTKQQADSKPPRPLASDSYEWGVGEDADLITLQPIWDPREVDWAFKEKIWNFLPGITPAFSEEDPMAYHFHHPDFAKIPRRTSIGNHVRLSRMLLHVMHLENLAGRTMAAEMWPATVALHHGLKAVYAPHPIWTDRQWPDWYLEAVLNANRGEDGQWGQRNDSVWVYDRSRNLIGTSFFVEAQFPKTLYRRWLGLRRIDASPLAEIGGKPWEEYGMLADLPNSEGVDEETLVGGSGRICLPPMLLQSIKEVYNEEPLVGPVFPHAQRPEGVEDEHLEDPVAEMPPI